MTVSVFLRVQLSSNHQHWEIKWAINVKSKHLSNSKLQCTSFLLKNTCWKGIVIILSEFSCNLCQLLFHKLHFCLYYLLELKACFHVGYTRLKTKTYMTVDMILCMKKLFSNKTYYKTELIVRNEMSRYTRCRYMRCK